MKNLENFRKGRVYITNHIASLVERMSYSFDEAIQPRLTELQQEIDKLYIERSALRCPTSQEVSQDSNELPSDEEMAYYDQLGELENKIESLIALQLSLWEMNIVSAYKSFEISLKQILKCAHPEIEEKNLYNWDSVRRFLKSYDIAITNLNGFTEVNELRLVNNSIKHSEEINTEVKTIAEFKNETAFSTDRLSLFFMRIKENPSHFLKSLSVELLRERFEFPEIRIDGLVTHYQNRMDTAAILQFCEKLGKRLKYQGFKFL